MEKEKQSVMICGAYGMNNAGDDEVLRSLVSAIHSLDAERPIYVLARGGKKTARKFEVAVIHPLRIFRWYKTMLDCCIFISGGGSLLQDVTSGRSMWYYLLTILAAKKQGCKVMIYGSGIGPIGKEKRRSCCTKVLSESVDVITVRDQASADYLEKLGVKGASVFVTADPAITMIPPEEKREKAIGIVLRPWKNIHKKLPYIITAIRYAYMQYGLQPVFFCFSPEDMPLTKEVMKRLTGIPCLLYNNPKEIGRMTITLSMRLHGLIMSLCGGAGLAAISYDPKVSCFCRENEFPYVRLRDVTTQSLKKIVDEAVRQDAEELNIKKENLIRKEKINKEILAELLSEETV